MRTRESSAKKAPLRKKTAPKRTTSSTRTRKPPRKRRKKRKSSKDNSNFEFRNSKFQIAYLGLGSNLGDRRAHLRAALTELARQATLQKVSSFYETEPVGFPDQPDFVNAVAAIRWQGTPRSLLVALQEIECRVGRTPSFRDGPREIDLDILDMGGLVRPGPDPILPHPRLASRRFVLEPLAEIAPGWAHPISGRTARELLAALPKRPAARRIRRSGGQPPQRRRFRLASS